MLNDVTNTASISSTDGSVFISAANILGPISAGNGDVGLDVYGNLSGTVTAGKMIAARVRGQTTQNLTASGPVHLWSMGNVSGNISAGGGGTDPQPTTVVTWGQLSGSSPSVAGT